MHCLLWRLGVCAFACNAAGPQLGYAVLVCVGLPKLGCARMFPVCFTVLTWPGLAGHALWTAEG